MIETEIKWELQGTDSVHLKQCNQLISTSSMVHEVQLVINLSINLLIITFIIILLLFSYICLRCKH